MFLLFASCLWADGPAYIVALYSEKQERGLSREFLFRIDGIKAAKLRYPAYYRLAVPPGVYTATVDGVNKPPIVCHAIAGEVCYFRIRTIGREGKPEADLISPEQAWRQLATAIPIDKEKVLLKNWK